MQSTVKLTFFKLYIQTENAQQQWFVCNHTTDESDSILFRLSCLATYEFQKSLKNVIF